jgi:hypothetical protein
MKNDLCAGVRAASANRMHSAALLRNCSKLGRCASISILYCFGDVKVWSSRMAGLAWSVPVSRVVILMRGTHAAQRGHAPNCEGAYGSASERSSILSVIVPADGTRAATAGKRRLRYVCVFWAALGQSRCLPVSGHMGCGAPSAMRGRKLNVGHLLRVLPWSAHQLAWR